MKNNNIIIIGGGLAGLTAAIHLSQKGKKVILFEKDVFPRHKVCGEYLSREVKPYLDRLEIPLESLNPKRITRLKYSTPGGQSLEVDLPLGAYGVSRYALDNLLFETALANGARIIREKVLKTEFLKDHFVVETASNQHTADFVLGGFGKRSLMDKNLDREFFKKPAPWVAVKSHYRLDSFPEDLVGLYNFRGGYCGISKTESDSINVCYLATYKSFREQKNPEKFQQKVLRKNPLLDAFFAKADPVFKQPLSIAQISFSRKQAVKDHILMLGDAAGLIHPLCGNGMAIAIHSAKLASEELLTHIQEGTSRPEMEAAYQNRWEKIFSRRFSTAAWLQKILLRENLAEFSQKLISGVPFLLPAIIRQTHGQPILE